MKRGINPNASKDPIHCAKRPPGVRHALLPPLVDGSSAPCGAELFLFSHTEELQQAVNPPTSIPSESVCAKLLRR
jgi:hypothetical protein